MSATALLPLSPFIQCPVFGCLSNAVWWAFRCLPRRRWKHTGSGFDSRHWLHKNPCGMFCASVTQFFICGAGYIVNFMIVYPWFGISWAGLFIAVVYNSCLFMASLSHYRAMTTNPGAVPKNAEPTPSATLKFRRLGKEAPKCRRTGTYKPPRSHFDSQLRRNVVRMDHHCPWVNNCIGIGNQKLFLLFLLYIALSCWISFGLLLAVWSKCGLVPPSRRLSRIIRAAKVASGALVPETQPDVLEDVARVCVVAGSGSGIFFYSLLCIEALLFGLFTACMLCDQLSSITSNQTKIDALQGKTFGKSSFFSNLGEVMGDAEKWWEWLLPMKPRWRNWEDVYGYCLPRRIHNTPMRRPTAEDLEWNAAGAQHKETALEKRSDHRSIRNGADGERAFAIDIKKQRLG